MNRDAAALTLRLGLAAIWLWESLGTKLFFNRDRSLALLRGTHLFESHALLFLNLICAFEVIVGLLLLAGWWVRPLAWVQIGVMGAFMVVALRVYPDLYAEPTAPIMKNIPCMAAALATWVPGAGSVVLGGEDASTGKES